MSALLAVFAIVAIVAAGDVLARGLTRDAPHARVARVGFACVLGPGVVAYVLFLLGLAGVPLSATTCRVLACTSIVVALAWRGGARAPAPADPLEFESSRSTRWIIASVPAACLVLGFAFVAALPPANDAFSNWGLKGLALWRDASLATPDLREDGRFLFHPNYPLLVPLAQAFVHAVAGEPSERAARALFLLTQAGAGLVLYCGLTRFVRAPIAALAGAMLSATPHFWRSNEALRFAGAIPAGYADPMFTALVAATVSAALSFATRSDRKDCRTALLLGVCVGFALFTKNEGMVLGIAVASAAIVGAAARRSSSALFRHLVPIAIAGATAAALAVPWFLFRAQLPARDENYHERIALGLIVDGAWRAPIIALAALSEALAIDRHGPVWIALCFALVLRVRRLAEPSIAFAFALLCAMAAAYAIVFLVTTLPIIDSLATSIPRTFFHMTPVAIVLVALLAAPRREDALR